MRVETDRPLVQTTTRNVLVHRTAFHHDADIDASALGAIQKIYDALVHYEERSTAIVGDEAVDELAGRFDNPHLEIVNEDENSGAHDGCEADVMHHPSMRSVSRPGAGWSARPGVNVVHHVDDVLTRLRETTAAYDELTLGDDLIRVPCLLRSFIVSSRLVGQ